MSGVFGGILGFVDQVGGALLYLLIGEQARSQTQASRWFRLAFGSVFIGASIAILMYVSGLAERITDTTYYLSKYDLEGLRLDGVPDNILKKLEPVYSEYFHGKGSFLRAINNTLGPEDAEKYEDVFLRHGLYNNTGLIALCWSIPIVVLLCALLLELLRSQLEKNEAGINASKENNADTETRERETNTKPEA